MVPPLHAWKRNNFGFPASALALDEWNCEIMSLSLTTLLSVPVTI